MQSKLKIFAILVGVLFMGAAFAEDDVDIEEQISAGEEVSAQAIDDYQVEGSLFQQITDLEQEKILMQLEKERAQLNLDLDRLAAEKIKLNMEIENLSGRAEQQMQEFDNERARLEAEAKRLEAQKEALENQESDSGAKESVQVKTSKQEVPFDGRYKLLNVVGVGTQLQATLQDTVTGQNKRISVGKKIDGYTVKCLNGRFASGNFENISENGFSLRMSLKGFSGNSVRFSFLRTGEAISWMPFRASR